jgi:hypothetical protein
MIFDCADQRPEITAAMSPISLHDSPEMVLASGDLIMLATDGTEVT